MPKPEQSRPDEELPFVVELWEEAAAGKVERVLAKATTLKLAQAILKSAEQDYPQRRVTLRAGDEIIRETVPQVLSRT